MRTSHKYSFFHLTSPTFKLSTAGQAFQTVYAVQSGHHHWIWRKGMKLNESDPVASPACALQLYAEWRPQWNVSKPILVEKSPRHIVMTRLLQHWFTPERSFFIVILRHPFGTLSSMFRKAADVDKKFNNASCGAVVVKEWLDMHETLFADLQHIKHKVVVHYERFAIVDPQGACTCISVSTL